MNCHESTTLLPSYGDGELDALRTASVERHLLTCGACAARRDGFGELRTSIRACAPYYTAPDRLRERFAQVEALPPVPRRRTLLAGAALGCAATILAWLAGTAMLDRVESGIAVRQVVASHVGATLGDRLVVVASSDRHTVKPWLTSHLDYAPPVKDLAGEGFPLEGGRVDTLEGRDVAALVYRYRDHRIGVFVRPHAGFDVLPETTVERGFNVVHARRAHMDWWVVSDLNAPQLRELTSSLARDD